MLHSIGSVLSVAIEEGLFYALVGVAVWLSFRILKFPDLSVEGVFTLGAAVTGSLVLRDVNPLLICASCFFSGALAGSFTAFLNTRLGIHSILSGILTTTALYSINLAILHGSNVSMLRSTTLFKYTASATGITNAYLINILVSGFITLVFCLALIYFLNSQLGFRLQATGQNNQMVRSLGVNTDTIKWVGLAISNGLIALSANLVAQRQGFADIGMGVGTVVVGLAAVILGERILRNRKIGWTVLAVVLGMLLYRIIISTALRVGLGPSNLKLVTAVLVILSLSLPRLIKHKNQPDTPAFDLEDLF